MYFFYADNEIKPLFKTEKLKRKHFKKIAKTITNTKSRISLYSNKNFICDFDKAFYPIYYLDTILTACNHHCADALDAFFYSPSKETELALEKNIVQGKKIIADISLDLLKEYENF